jgi:CRP-like cAMP-binding protein
LGADALRDGWCSCPEGKSDAGKPLPRQDSKPHSLAFVEDFALLEPLLAPVDLPVRKQLEAPKKRIDQVYFIEAGFASVVANGSSKPSIEVGIIGREGMTGLATVMGYDRATHATYTAADSLSVRTLTDCSSGFCLLISISEKL